MKIKHYPYMQASPDGGEAGGGGASSGPTPEQITRAKSMGWRESKEDWHGRGEWVPADEFLEKADKNLPIMHRRLEAAETEAKQTKAQLAQVIADTRQIQNLAYKQAEEEFNERLADLKKEKAEALTDNDGARAVAAEDAIEELKANKPTPPKEDKQQAQGDGEVPPALKNWLTRNPWYKEGTEAYDLAQAQALVIARRTKRETGEELRGEALAEEVTKFMKKNHPDLVGVPPPSGHEGGQHRESTGSQGGGAHSWKNLPADAKAVFERNVERKILGIDPKTKAQTPEAIEKARLNFVKYYEWDEK